jgi:hypothetical protein
LIEVIASAMTGGELRQRFDAAVAARGGQARSESAAARARHLELFGWKPAAEIDELAAAMAGYAECVDEISDVWMIGPALGPASELPVDAAAIWDGFEGAMWLLCGAVLVGHDPSGDTAWCSTIPSPIDTAVIYRYDHEVGALDRVEGCSIGSFVIDTWADRDEPEARGRIGAAALAHFEKLESKLERRPAPAWADPIALFERSRWLLSFGAGETGFGFASDLCKAAPFAAWEAERELIDEAPWLANYWLLAHFFLANRRAAAEVVDRAASSKAELTRGLAWAIDRALADESAGLFAVTATQLAELKAACAKNAIAELLEGGGKGDGGGGIDEAEILAELAGGADPWALIERHPDSVAVHDVVLEQVARGGDKELAKVVTSYFRERGDAAYSQWPYDWQPFDRRLSTAVAAAFRAGLAYDADHDRAYAGITQTLARLDDDKALAAYRAAIETLAVDDDRLEYVIAGLGASAHAGAPELLRRAAWRTFELLDQARANDEKLAAARERDGLTLDNMSQSRPGLRPGGASLRSAPLALPTPGRSSSRNIAGACEMFDTQNHLLAAMRAVLDGGGADAAALADKILSEKQSFKLFGARCGDAFRIAGERGLDKHAGTAFGYVDAVGGLRPRDAEGFVDPTTLFNFGEACLAAAKLDRARIAPIARALFDRETGARCFDLDIKAATIGALLLCEGTTGELVGWVERLLGNRTNSARIAPALRAAGDGRLEVAREWIRCHVYSEKNDLMAKDAVITRCARMAMAQLGEPDLPDFDEDSKFAVGVTGDDLAAGFAAPEKYWPGHLCKRIVEDRAVSDANLEAVAAFAADQVRYSADNGWRESGEAGDAIKALGIMGEAALPRIAAMLELPHLAPGMRTDLLLAMRFAVPEADRWIEAARLPVDEVLAELAAPSPRWMAHLDLLAGRARIDAPERATAAIAAATRWRYQRAGSVFDSSDPALQHLPMAWATCPGAAAGLAGLAAAHAGNHYVAETLAAAVAAAEAGAGLAEPPPLPANMSSDRAPYGWSCKLEITGATIRAEADEIYCNLLADDARASEARCADPALGASIARMASVLGYK